MEDVLDLYAQPYDADYPQVCFDERPVQLLGDTYAPIPLQPGQGRRYDYEYARAGTANLFMMVQPLAGWRMVKTTQRRTKVDFAECMRDLVDVYFPEATRIRAVLDNLNTHNPSSLYVAFAPAEARRILRKLEFHYTPKHGSWLNMAEIEISVLSRQCLQQRIPTIPNLDKHVTAWTTQRNEQGAKIKWCFSLDNARTKLARLYP
jgi:DDE superfamily endonuclease